MAHTVFTDGVTLTASTWFQDVDTVAYTLFGNGTSYTGVMTLAGTTQSTSTITGQAIIAGGVGIAKNLWVGGTGNIAGATTIGGALTYGGVALTAAVTGTGKMVLDTSPTITTPIINSAAHVGGTWVADATWTLPALTLGGTVSGGGNQINNVIIGAITPLAGSFTTLVSTSTTDATSIATGAVQLAGGIGVSKSVWAGTGVYAATAGLTNPVSLAGNSSNATYGSVSFNASHADPGRLGFTGGGGTDKNLYVDVPTGGAFTFRINNVTVLTQSATALTVASLAGSGTRAVVVDANGVMSAP